MKKELTYNEAIDYVKKNGVTIFTIDTICQTIPSGTKLYFGIDDLDLTTYDCDLDNKNKEFCYSFDYSFWGLWKSYDGKFIVETNFEVGDLIQATKNCSDIIKGKQYIVYFNKTHGKLFTRDKKMEENDVVGCVCQEDWILIQKAQDIVKDLKEFKYQWKKGDKLELTDIPINKEIYVCGKELIAAEDISTNNSDETTDVIADGKLDSLWFVRRFKLVKSEDKQIVKIVKGGDKKMTTKTLYKVVVVDKRNSEVIVDTNVVALDSKTAYVKALDGVTYDVKDLDFFHVSTSSITDFEVEKECKKTTK